MAIKHLKDALGEASSLYAYALCSLVGNFVVPGHHENGRRRPVILVPGFLGRGLNFLRLKRALTRRGYPVFVADLGYGVGCIEEKSGLLEAFFEDHELDDVYVVGHSMGGQIALAMCDEARRRVRHFITLGTAFRGSVLSYLFPFFPAARQLNPNSELSQRLVERLRDHENITSVVARWDEIAVPPSSCRVDGCPAVTGVAGHAQLIMRSSAIDQIAGLLDELEET